MFSLAPACLLGRLDVINNPPVNKAKPNPLVLELELELIQTQMAQKPMLRAEVYARALRASQKRERERMYGWARDAPDEWAGRGRVREWKALVWGWRDL